MAVLAPQVEDALSAGKFSAAIEAAFEITDIELSEKELNLQQCMRRRAEREAKKKRDKEMRKAAEKAKCDAALEAAFDGDLQAVLNAFDTGVEHDACDHHGTSLLSEAAGGGQPEIVGMLLAEGADPNSRGRYGRTPLWRAAFAGNIESTRELLRGGGDPREPDDEGVRPIGVANGDGIRDLLASWDVSVTDDARAKLIIRRQSQVRDAENEHRNRLKEQLEEFDAAILDAERRFEIAKREVAQRNQLLFEYRQQKANLVQQGRVEDLQELEILVQRAEAVRIEAERIARECDWKLQRVCLKKKDWENEQARRQMKKLGKSPGFRVEVPLSNSNDFCDFLRKLSNELEVIEDVQLGIEGNVTLKKGDVALLEGPLLAGRRNKDELLLLQADGLDSIEWPVSMWFNHGFDAVVRIRDLSDIIFRDPGQRRKSDGRWPLVIDPSGTAGKFFTYSGATKFTVAELHSTAVEDSSVEDRLRRAILRSLLHGGAVVIDMENFNFPLETLGASFNHLEQNLFEKLIDRSALYSYLLPRRFMSLVTSNLQEDFPSLLFDDEHISKFLLVFVSAVPEPELEFAKSFYTIRVRCLDKEDQLIEEITTQ